MKFSGIVAGVVLILATSFCAQAQNEQKLEPCKPVVKDGTQVLEYVFAGGDCSSNNGKLVRIVDFKLGVICSKIQSGCVAEADMDERVKAYYNKMRDLANLSKSLLFQQCVQTDGITFSVEMVTGKKIDCNPSKHAIRSYEFVLGRACVMDGGHALGCVPITHTIVSYLSQ